MRKDALLQSLRMARFICPPPAPKQPEKKLRNDVIRKRVSESEARIAACKYSVDDFR
jgi:hypothetical protein